MIVLPSPSLTGGESMAATNGVSDQRPAMSAPGQPSEAVKSTDVTTPGPVIPPERPRSVLVSASSSSREDLS